MCRGSGEVGIMEGLGGNIWLGVSGREKSGSKKKVVILLTGKGKG